MKKTPFVHNLFLGLLTGLILGFLAFFAVNTMVVATNAIAVKAGALPPGPYDPPWAYPLMALGIGFLVPIVGAIVLDMNNRTEDTTTAPPLIMDIGINLAHALENLAELSKAQGKKKQEDGPPETS